jgi:hypothetical protein
MMDGDRSPDTGKKKLKRRDEVKMAGTEETPVLPDDKARNVSPNRCGPTILSSPCASRTLLISQSSLNVLAAELREQPPFDTPGEKEADTYAKLEITWPGPTAASPGKCMLPPKKKGPRSLTTPEVFRPFCSLENTELTVQNLRVITTASPAVHKPLQDS